MMMASASMVSPASRRNGVTTCGTKSSFSRAGSKLNFRHARPSMPPMIEPPETVDTRLTVPSRPVS